MVDLWGVSHTVCRVGLNTPRYDMSSHGHTWSTMSKLSTHGGCAPSVRCARHAPPRPGVIMYVYIVRCAYIWAHVLAYVLKIVDFGNY